jgi:hypothetical protein
MISIVVNAVLIELVTVTVQYRLAASFGVIVQYLSRYRNGIRRSRMALQLRFRLRQNDAARRGSGSPQY